MNAPSGRGAAAGAAVFVVVWWAYFALIDYWPFGPAPWSEPERWMLRGLTLTTIVLSIGGAIAVSAYVDTRKKRDE